MRVKPYANRKALDTALFYLHTCILRSVTDVDAFQSGRFAKQNGRPETQKFLLTLSV